MAESYATQTWNLEQLERAAHRLAGGVVGDELVYLRGPIGAGKTTFIRALGSGLGLNHPDRVCSPTFNLCVRHPGRIALVHADLYRLDDLKPGARVAAFEALGLESVTDLVELAGLADEGNAGGPTLVTVEWPELWPGTSADVLDIELALADEGRARTVSVAASGARSKRLLDAWWQA